MRTTLFLLIPLFLASTACAQKVNPPEKLPPPGSWITYQVLQPDTRNLNLEIYYTIRLLEQEQRAGEACRWVEFDWSIAEPGKRHRIVNRYLIPEKALQESEHPYLQLKAAIHGEIEPQGGDSDQTKGQLATIEEQALTKDYIKSCDDDGWELLLFPGLQQQTEKAEAITKIGYQHGTLTCRKEMEGQYKVVLRDNVVNQIFSRVEEHVTYRISYHPDVPFGVARAVFEFKDVALDRNGKVISSGQSHPDTHWLLHDFGKDAKSAFKMKKPTER